MSPSGLALFTPRTSSCSNRTRESRLLGSNRSSSHPSGFLVAALLVASGLLWAVLFFGTLAHLSELANGISPFDIRPGGYSYEDAVNFLSSIGEQGRRYYAFPQLTVDMVYPPLYVVSRGLALWWLTMPGQVHAAPLPLHWRYGLIAVPAIVASLDIIENSCIAVMLWSWPDLSRSLVDISSWATRLKIVFGATTELVMAVLFVFWVRRKFRTVRS